MLKEETVDEILEGSLKIRQSRRGYRFNLDSLILAHFVTAKPRSVNLDIGCGNGVIALVLARRFPESRWHGLELQPALAELAKKNAEDNGLDRRVTIDQADAGDIKNIYAARTFDNVVFNPPYRKINSGRINPLAQKAIARHEIHGSLALFLEAARHALNPTGRVFTIYPASRMVTLITHFRTSGIEPKRMKLVFSDAESVAQFVVVEGRRGSREELKMEPPLYIYERGRAYTEAMKRIFTDLTFYPTAGG